MKKELDTEALEQRLESLNCISDEKKKGEYAEETYLVITLDTSTLENGSNSDRKKIVREDSTSVEWRMQDDSEEFMPDNHVIFSVDF